MAVSDLGLRHEHVGIKQGQEAAKMDLFSVFYIPFYPKQEC